MTRSHNGLFRLKHARLRPSVFLNSNWLFSDWAWNLVASRGANSLECPLVFAPHVHTYIPQRIIQVNDRARSAAIAHMA